MHAGTLGTVSTLDSYLRHGARPAPRETRASDRPCESKRATAADGPTAALRYRRTERTALYIETQEGDGEGQGVRIEEVIHVTKTGVEILSKWPSKELTVIEC